MTFPGYTNNYSQNAGLTPSIPYNVHADVRAPVSTDVNYVIGTWWLYKGNSLWYLLSQSTANAVLSSTWIEISTSSGDVLSVLGTTNQITVITTAGVATVSLPSAITTPGSLTTTTTLTATLGNITATNGNFVATTSGTGLVLTPVTGSGTTTATANGRSGQVTITTPSIAAGATFTMTITNSAVTANTTDVLYSLVGGTTGAALTIQSVTNSSSTSAVVIQNGTGATTNTASLILTFLVLN
jgi:hypothetical protein